MESWIGGDGNVKCAVHIRIYDYINTVCKYIYIYISISLNTPTCGVSSLCTVIVCLGTCWLHISSIVLDLNIIRPILDLSPFIVDFLGVRSGVTLSSQ